MTFNPSRPTYELSTLETEAVWGDRMRGRPVDMQS